MAKLFQEYNYGNDKALPELLFPVAPEDLENFATNPFGVVSSEGNDVKLQPA
jgi:hypothetical protein